MKKVIPFNSDRDVVRKAKSAAPVTRPAAPELPTPAVGPEQQLQLLQRLMGCTDQQTLIARFYRWASDLTLTEGVRYRASQSKASLLIGQRRHHSAQYDLSLDKSPVGDISLYRRKRYSEEELVSIEEALGSLARALRAANEIESLRSLVTQDPLTGLGNRSSLKDWIDRELARARRHGDPLAVMMIDVDHFKTINDKLGHLGGDQVLRTIAEVLRASTRRSDLVFRYGGDEFTVLLPHTDRSGAQEAARQIRANLAKVDTSSFGDKDVPGALRPDVSIGIACYQDGDDDDALMQRADTHLYHAKAQGRARVCTAV
ncbi:MAG: GGDEF domain-containing protein [Pseudomonadota bacterium]